MDAEQRLTAALVRDTYQKAMNDGYGFLFDEQIGEMAEQVGATAQQARQVQREILEAYLFEQGNSHCFYRATPRLFEEYERTDRAAAYHQNAVRRWILEQVGELDAKSTSRSTGLIHFTPEDDDDYSPPEQFVAAKVLHYESCLEKFEGQPGSFTVKLGSKGYDTLRDEKLMRRLFPISVTEDEEAQLPIVPDVLRTVITTCEELLTELGWRQVLVELSRGDKEYGDEDWVNAVREYYSATESGLKYALDLEEALGSDDHRALHRLAKEAASQGLIPVNYSALFGFADSIRSPRSHGGGKRAEDVGEVPVGQAEALLMGHQARALLVYLGQRASAAQATRDGGL